MVDIIFPMMSMPIAVAAATTNDRILSSCTTRDNGVSWVLSHPAKPWPAAPLETYWQFSSLWKYLRMLLDLHDASPVISAMLFQSPSFGNTVIRALC